MHCLDIKQPLAAERPLSKKVLIDLRRCSTVGFDPALSCKQPVIGRDVLQGGQRRDHARLINGIAAGRASPGLAWPWPVFGVGRHTNQFAQASGR